MNEPASTRTISMFTPLLIGMVMVLPDKKKFEDGEETEVGFSEIEETKNVVGIDVVATGFTNVNSYVMPLPSRSTP